MRAWRVSRPTLALGSLLGLALAARLATVLMLVGFRSPPEYDGQDYDRIARNLVAGEGYSLYGPTAFRPPGYPLFLAGLHALTGDAWAAARVLHAMLGTATVGATYWVARRAFGNERLALLAAGLAAFHPVLLYLTGILYPEVLATLLVTIAAGLLSSVIETGQFGTGKAVLLGCVLAASVLLRPAVLPFSLAALGILAWLELKRGRAPLRAGVVAAVILLSIAPWALRNYRVFGEVIPLATEGGVTFWGGNHAEGNGGHVEPSPATWSGADPPRNLFGWARLSEKESERRFYRAAVDWIRREPGKWLSLLPLKVARSWTLAFGNEARADSLPGWTRALYLLYPLSVLAGLALSWPHRRRLIAIYSLLAAQTLTTLAFYGSSRQSALVIPCALVLSAYALNRSPRPLPGARIQT